MHSVGFSNTQGLAEALGKLAAGDLDAINNGGYGNLLIMAANRAGLSIADILAKGLDDSDTNELMKAMVEYLGDIYAETKNSKVVAQQFANVYGLTASDLKAAANLYGSTDIISKNMLGYSGMLSRLEEMANSIYSRTSTGEMMTNLIDNLKFATASTMATNPALYATYTLASMLDETVGGINIPAISVFGNMVDLETTVSNLLRAGAIGGGILGGIGRVIGGLGNAFNGSNMLKAFGIDNNITTLSRGTGTGIAAMSGNTYSESGYYGNAEGGDVQQKAYTDAMDEGNSKLEVEKDKAEEVTLNTVDSHIVDI